MRTREPSFASEPRRRDGDRAVADHRDWLRVVVFGYVIGQTALADAYTIGNETPNIVYELLIGGVLSATLVPLFTSFLERDDDESPNVVITVALVVLAAVTAVAVLAAPLIFGLYTTRPGRGVDPDDLREVGTMLTRVFLLQIFFYGAVALANAVLNSRRRFFAAAWSPILANVIIIVTLLSLPDAGERTWALDDVLTDDRLRWTLALGTTAGIAAMALVLVPAVRRAGFHFRPNLQFRHPAVRRLVLLSGWTLGFVVANQVTIVVVRNLADPGSGERARLLRGVHVLRPPPRPARRVDRHHVRPGDGPIGHPPRSQMRSATRRRSGSG